MQGKCSTLPPPATLGAELKSLAIEDPEPWEAPRCVLLTDDTLFIVSRPGLWLDALHIQVVASKLESPKLLSVWYWGSLFLTNSVVQGDSQADPIGLQVISSLKGAYVERVLQLSYST